MALVSVLIPAFRAMKTLRTAVTSVLRGGLEADQVEILVEADDGADYAASVAGLPGVRLAKQAGRHFATGAEPARNRALMRARGRFVACLDADDAFAPGWLAAQLPLAVDEGASVSALEIWESGAAILRLWQDRHRIGFADLAESGASVRGLVARGLCPAFVDAPAQDILHMTSVMARRGGSLPVAAIPYLMHTGSGSVTSAPEFSARVNAAYQDHIARLEGDAGLPAAMACAAADVFRAKTRLNAAFVAEGAGRSYYRFIADRLGGAQPGKPVASD